MWTDIEMYANLRFNGCLEEWLNMNMQWTIYDWDDLMTNKENMMKELMTTGATWLALVPTNDDYPT